MFIIYHVRSCYDYNIHKHIKCVSICVITILCVYMCVCVYTHIHIWTHILNTYEVRSLPILSNMMLWCFLFVLLGLVMVISQIHIGTDLNEKVVCWRSTNGFTVYLSTPKESTPLEFSCISIDLVLENKKHHHKLDFLPPTILFLHLFTMLVPSWPPTKQNRFVCILFWRDSEC